MSYFQSLVHKELNVIQINLEDESFQHKLENIPLDTRY